MKVEFLLALVASPLFIDGTTSASVQPSGEKAAWADLNRDSYPDLIAGGVWLNRSGKSFEKVAEMGPAVAADYDNDGWTDLFDYGNLRLWRGIDGRSWAPVPIPGIPATVSRAAAWSDLDQDGRIDLVVGGYEDWERQITYPTFVLLNRPGGFSLAWQNNSFRTRGITIADFDEDGQPDLYTSNYRLQPNQLLNWRSGSMVDRAPEVNAVATSEGFGGGHSIGACWGDFDSDGKLDLFAGNFAHVDSRGDQPKSRFLRQVDSRFEDRGPCGVFYQESYASPAAGDVDNDSDLDLFFTTVYGTASFGRPNFPTLFLQGAPWEFVGANATAGLDQLPPTYQAAFADWDRDGDLDLVTAGKLYLNQTAGKSWLTVALEGDGRTVNRSAVGAQVRVRLRERRAGRWQTDTLTRSVEAGTGEGNQNDLTLHFGLRNHRARVDLEIQWPNGRRDTRRNVRLNQHVRIRYQA